MFMNPVGDVPWGLIQVALFALPTIGLLAGGAWIIRIARKTGDEPSHWRDRDR